MCLHVCFSFCRSGSLNKALLCVRCRGCYRKRISATGPLAVPETTESETACKEVVRVMGAWGRVCGCDGGWLVGERLLLVLWSACMLHGFISELFLPGLFAPYEKQHCSQLSFFIIYWFVFTFSWEENSAISCFLFQSECTPLLPCSAYSIPRVMNHTHVLCNAAALTGRCCWGYEDWCILH